MAESKLLGEIGIFGTAIYQVSPEQRHAAIVFKEREKAHPSLLHLAWHYDLRCEPLKAAYRCVPASNFDEEELQLFAEQASRIYEKNSAGIPYGMEYTGASVFGGDLKFLDSPGAGLTCATFILGFFDSLGFEILDIDSWQARDDDGLWQKGIFAALEGNLSKDAAVKQKTLIGHAFRFRPEEVVGSVGVFEADPLGFEESLKVGARLLSEIRNPPLKGSAPQAKPA
ncbi:hypothetical protein [Pseudomonas sp. Irchel s3h17]|uniref:hypothetical protein n=1 Tax=Pseudomonas sp. Irchel s3h17 TaxID=2009182 RepID=UPI000BA368DB|nr:hypothetical protein [Pseudomonas sp. Irchel s3h17]